MNVAGSCVDALSKCRTRTFAGSKNALPAGNERAEEILADYRRGARSGCVFGHVRAC